MKTRVSRMQVRSGAARRVSTHGSPMPLSHLSAARIRSQSAGRIAQSKTWRHVVVALGFLVVAITADAQSYSIDWFTINGGGGTSAGGVFAVSGTIGQPDANQQPMTGGTFSLTGGFCSLFAVQTPGAPLSSIVLTSTNTAVVTWLSTSTGFALQQSTNVNTTNGIPASETVADNGTNKFIIANPPAGKRFFRLFKP